METGSGSDITELPALRCFRVPGSLRFAILLRSLDELRLAKTGFTADVGTSVGDSFLVAET